MLKWFQRKKAAEPAAISEPAVVDSDPAEGAHQPESPPIGSLDPTAAPRDPSEATEPAGALPLDAPIPEIAESGPEASLEAPAPKRSLFARLRDRLSRTKSVLVDRVRTAIRLHGRIDEELLEEIQDILIQSDVGVATTTRIVDRMRKEANGAQDAEALLGLFKETIAGILSEQHRPLTYDGGRPRILLFVGVNGTGKTTTIGKIGRELAVEGKKVMMVAADTFRAAAADQLQIWAERTGSAIVRQAEGADPAAVVYEALEGAREEPPDVILIDTAGRLHTKVGLMEQLKKIRRVIQRHCSDGPHETILVLDATTGQNALNQLRTFHEATELTGMIMTKLDGTAKGGILVACKDAVALPIYKIGIGEQSDDLRDFNPRDFVEALFSSQNG